MSDKKKKKKFKVLDYNAATGCMIWDRKNHRPAVQIPARDTQKETEKFAKICCEALNENF